MIIHVVDGVRKQMTHHRQHPLSRNSKDVQTVSIGNITPFSSQAAYDVIEEQLNRQELLVHACPLRPKLAHYMIYQHLIVSEDLEVLYCPIPKVASTNWKHILGLLGGRLDENFIQKHTQRIRALYNPSQGVHSKAYMDAAHLLKLYLFSSRTNATHHYQLYFKFLFVRDPFDRLLSAYIDKYTTMNDMYRNYFSRLYGIPVNDITFEVFLNYTSNDILHGDVVDPHFASHVDLCLPCDIEYDFVGKIETFKEDAEFVIGLFKLSSATVNGDIFARGNAPSIQRGKYRRHNQFYQLVSDHVMDKVRQAYAIDFKLFGYDPFRL